MSTAEFIVGIIAFGIAGLCAFISVRHFMEMGYLLNNAYIWASKEEREKLDKKPYYRQSAIVFGLICFGFIVIGLSVIFQNYTIELLEIPLFAAALIYAIVSSAKIRNL